MTVAFASHGGVASIANQTVSPTYPGSIADGDGLLLVRAAKPDTTVLVTPSGWTLLDERAGGAGVFGNDTGPMRIAAYWREADGTETGTLACGTSPGTVDVQQALITRWTKDTGSTWDVAASGGVDSVPSNDWTVTADPAFDVAAGDVVQVALTWPTDSVRTWSAESLSASGATLAGVAVPLVAQATGLGADMATRVHQFGCSAGSSSAAAVYVGTVNSATNVNGPTTMVRLREVGDALAEVALTSAAVAFSAPAVTAVPDAVNVALVPTVATIGGRPVVAVPGSVTVGLTVATVGLTAVSVDADPGSVAVPLTPATFALAPGSVSVESETVAARGTVRIPARATARTPSRSGVRIR